jgi:hypothetical protein
MDDLDHSLGWLRQVPGASDTALAKSEPWQSPAACRGILFIIERLIPLRNFTTAGLITNFCKKNGPATKHAARHKFKMLVVPASRIPIEFKRVNTPTPGATTSTLMSLAL